MKFPSNPGLARWVHTQRMRRRMGKMSAGRARQLEKLGFVFEGRSQWEQRFLELVRFKEERRIAAALAQREAAAAPTARFPGLASLAAQHNRAGAGGYFLVACVARRGPGALVGTGGLLRGGNGVRRGVRRKPELLCGARIALPSGEGVTPVRRSRCSLSAALVRFISSSEACGSSNEQMPNESTTVSYLRTFVLLIMTTYMNITTSVLQYIGCNSLPHTQRSFLIADPSVHCDDPKYLQWLPS